jgi:hypothetical protein
MKPSKVKKFRFFFPSSFVFKSVIRTILFVRR